MPFNQESVTTNLVVADPWPVSRTNNQRQVIARRYRVQRVLGQGAAAVVHEVVDTHTGGHMALKQLLPHNTRQHLGFRREFHTLASLRHPNIVKAFEYGVDRDRPFYTMELLDGEYLGSLGVTPRMVCLLLRDVASALAFLHARRLIHGDISRRNVGCTLEGTIKLLDFGLLATVGITGKGKGTLPYIAPEVCRGLPLDHRVDLFSLGALAYRLLTGRSPYPAADESQLGQAFSQRPVPPSQLNRTVPPELSALILSLVNVDPLGRPTSAAEVIDRVQAVAQLPPVPGAQVVRGYLASSTLIGRTTEMRELRQAVADARRGCGRAVVIHGPSGMGKTRILAELRVEAQLSGARVLFARCTQQERQPYSVLLELIRPLVQVDADAPRVEPLHELVRWLGERPQQRLLIQRRLALRILAAADQQPLVLLVDDLQRCDEASAAVLASLAYQARSHRVVLATTLQTDEPELAPGALTTIKLHSRHLGLRGLQEPDVRNLLGAIFGEVDNVEQLGRWIHHASDGSPLCCTEIAHTLVERGTIRYEDGVWQIPSSLGAVEPPGALVEAMEQRLRALGPVALRLAEALSVHGGEIDLDLCVALADVRDVPAAFAALDELVEQEILLGAGERLRFRHDGIRTALLRALAAERRRELHLRVGHLLEQHGAGDEEIGWHLLHGGEELRGARLLERAGRRHFEAQALADVAEPLEAALGVFERLGTPAQCCELRQTLVRVGLVCSRELALRHGGTVVSELQRYSGALLAQRLRRWVGGRAGLVLAMLLLLLRWPFMPRSRRGPNPITAFVRFVTMVNFVVGAKAVSFDLEGARQTLEVIRPVALLWRRWWPPYASYMLGCSFELMLTGRWREAQSNLELFSRRYSSTWLPIRPIFDLELGLGACRYMLATIAAQQLDSRCLEEFERLESMDLHFFEVSGKLGRVLFHRLRGEESLAQALEEEVRLTFVQMGSMWPWESQLSWISAMAHCVISDLSAMKRSIAALELLVAQGVRVDAVLALCRGMYQIERGELEAARRSLRTLAEQPTCRDNPMFLQACLNGLSHVLILMRRPREAQDVARRCNLLGRNPDTSIKATYVVNVCTLALSEAMLGKTESAVERLDSVLAAVQDNPLICGTLHEYRTRVAMLSGETGRVRHHLSETEYWFRNTRNPALVARYERLAADVAQQTRSQVRQSAG